MHQSSSQGHALCRRATQRTQFHTCHRWLAMSEWHRLLYTSTETIDICQQMHLLRTGRHFQHQSRRCYDEYSERAMTPQPHHQACSSIALRLVEILYTVFRRWPRRRYSPKRRLWEKIPRLHRLQSSSPAHPCYGRWPKELYESLLIRDLMP